MSIPDNMRECVKNHANLAAGVGVVSSPFAHADIPVMVGIWVDMMLKLAAMSSKPLDREAAKKIAVSVVVGVATAQAAIKTVTTVGQWLLAIPTAGVSLLFGAAANGGLNYTTTRVVGMEAAELLESDKLTAENLLRASLAALGLRFKGYGKNGDTPPDPSDFGL